MIDIADQLDWVEDNVKRRLERVPGVSRITLYGVPRRQVNVYLDPDRLAARGLTLMQRCIELAVALEQRRN